MFVMYQDANGRKALASVESASITDGGTVMFSISTNTGKHVLSVSLTEMADYEPSQLLDCLYENQRINFCAPRFCRGVNVKIEN